ncbi:unnamed protein product [Enterobius vermicularis]|uniref:Transmembrane protein 230 n=1 Tax=Enterobius vermicularis TaxID=51028 RepID=A0A0N4UZ55_ENTVE|nr:unnamed protein product [Enterobius vermicularis]
MAFSGHHRNASQGQQLIGERYESGDEEGGESLRTTASPCHPMTSMAASSPSYTPSTSSITTNPAPRQYCSDPKLRDNMKVVVGSVILTILGSGQCLVVIREFSVCGNLHGWIFLFAGFLFFVPGAYHVVYITCTVCGRPGYSLSNLPTFNK